MPKKIEPDTLVATLFCDECRSFTVHTFSRASVIPKANGVPPPEDDEDILAALPSGRHYALIYECGACDTDRRWGTTYE